MTTQELIGVETRTNATASWETALCRSIIYEAVATGLRPPTHPTLRVFQDDDSAAALLDAAQALDADHSSGGELAASTLTVHVEALAESARTADTAELTIAHRCLFGHATRGKITPYETEYGSEALFRQSSELADIGGFYNAFGLQTAADQHERGDHIATECEFLAFLARKQAFFAARDDWETVAELGRAQRLFLRDHLGRFGLAFAHGLTREATHEFYKDVGLLLAAHIEGECRRFGVSAGPVYLPLSPDANDAVPMACGSCELSRHLDEDSTE